MATFSLEENFSSIAIAGTAIYLVGWIFYKLAFRYTYFSPYRNYPGPKRSSWIFGNMGDLFNSDPAFIQFERWREEYGRVLRFGHTLGRDGLLITDPVALKHILLDRSYDYPKSERARLTLTAVAGSGILVVEGDVHKKQKRLLSPAFSQPHATSLTPIFLQQSSNLAEIWAKQIGSKQSDTIDVFAWISKLALDMVGLAGFGYEFKSMYNDDSPLANAFNELFKAEPAPDHKTLFIRGIVLSIPILQFLPIRPLKAAKKSMAAMQVESRKIIAERKQELAGSEEFHGKDLITLLLKANAQADAKAKLTDAEVTAQITTFLIAGSETTATAASWCLFYLAKHPQIQEKLRKELLENRQDGKFAPETVNSLPYLDAVVREINRIMPSVTATERQANFDDVIPLSKPVKMANGQELSELPIKAGTFFSIAISELNHREELFGKDINIFRPERWLDQLPEDLTSQTQGYCAYSHLLTFLGGPRSCIGRHFAVAETKAIIATTIASFKFEEREDKPDIIYRVDVTAGPFIRGEEASIGKQLPLKVTKL